MSYTVKPGSIFGRIGTEVGKGLAEQIPKEVERTRLAQGLEKLSQQQGLTPFQQLGQLATLPGVTPQLIQSGAELLKQQSLRDIYGRGRGQGQPIPQAQPSRANLNVPFAGMQEHTGQVPTPREANLPSDFATEEQAAQTAAPGIVEKSLARPEAQPVPPWSQERYNQEVSDILDRDPYITLPEARNLAKENEQRYLTQPAAQRELDETQLKNRDIAYAEFDRQLGEILHTKDKAESYKKLPGELQAGLKKQMEADIRDGMPHPTAAAKWVKKAANQVKAKNELDALANQDWTEKLDSQTTRNKLDSIGKIFAESGNKENLYNYLQDRNNFNLSPQRAAQTAFPLSKGIAPIVQAVKFGDNSENSARKIAGQIENQLTGEDSLLAIARTLTDKNPTFNQAAFFNQLRADSDTLGLTPRQRRELGIGEKEFFPTWGDIWLFPFGKR